MRGTHDAIADYLSAAATLFDRYGVTLRFPSGSGELELLEDAAGLLSFELLGDLPDSLDPARSEITIREGFEPVGQDLYARTRYEYELVDREREYRRAFHLHFPDWFRERYLVVVHEHCERPIGLELTRFGGHRDSWDVASPQRSPHAENEATIRP